MNNQIIMLPVVNEAKRSIARFKLSLWWEGVGKVVCWGITFYLRLYSSLIQFWHKISSGGASEKEGRTSEIVAWHVKLACSQKKPSSKTKNNNNNNTISLWFISSQSGFPCFIQRLKWKKDHGLTFQSFIANTFLTQGISKQFKQLRARIISNSQ